MRLLLDEMYSDAVATQLRARGHDAYSVRDVEVGLAGARDEEVIGFIQRDGRTLVTDDVRDFGVLESALLASGGHHQGIIYTTNRQFRGGDSRSMGRLVKALAALLNDPPELRDRSTFLRP